MRTIVVLALLLVGCANVAREAGNVAAKDLADSAWIGVSADGGSYYRLVLDEEGTGRCATAAGRDERLYDIRSWRVDREDRLTIHLDHRTGGELHVAPHLRTLIGSRKRSRLELVAEDRHTVTFWREPELLRNTKRLQEKMAR